MLSSAVYQHDDSYIIPTIRGAKIIRRNAFNGHLPSKLQIHDIFNLAFNVYLLNQDSELLRVNESTVKNFNIQSVNDIKHKTVADFVPKKFAEKILVNDKNIIKTKKMNMYSEKAYGIAGLVDTTYFSIKFPCYDEDNYLLGIFGFALKRDKNFQRYLMEIVNRGFLLPNSIAEDSMTDREFEIIDLLAKHYSPKEISVICNISVRTVEHHIENLRRKFNAYNKTDLLKKIIWN